MTQQIRNKLLAGGLGLAVRVVVGAMVWQGVRLRARETVSVMHSPHIPTDSDLGKYNSYPPTSGLHYVRNSMRGFMKPIITSTLRDALFTTWNTAILSFDTTAPYWMMPIALNSKPKLDL